MEICENPRGRSGALYWSTACTHLSRKGYPYRYRHKTALVSSPVPDILAPFSCGHLENGIEMLHTKDLETRSSYFAVWTPFPLVRPITMRLALRA